MHVTGAVTVPLPLTMVRARAAPWRHSLSIVTILPPGYSSVYRR